MQDALSSLPFLFVVIVFIIHAAPFSNKVVYPSSIGILYALRVIQTGELDHSLQDRVQELLSRGYIGRTCFGYAVSCNMGIPALVLRIGRLLIARFAFLPARFSFLYCQRKGFDKRVKHGLLQSFGTGRVGCTCEQADEGVKDVGKRCRSVSLLGQNLVELFQPNVRQVPSDRG